MKTFFLGPYRHNNLLGKASSVYLANLADSVPELTSRHIPVSANTTDSQNEAYNTEKNYYNSYDIILQHLPVNLLGFSKSHKNIAIPIFDTKNINTKEIKILRQFDEVWADTKYIYQTLQDKDINVKFVKPVLDNKKLYFTKDKENFSFWNFYKKMYFIGEYTQNFDIVQHIILDFTLFATLQKKWCLILYLPNITSEQKNDLSKTCLDIFKKAGYVYNNIPVVIVDDDCSYQSISRIHNSCDVLLNIGEVFNPINYWYASAESNKIVDFVDCKQSNTFIKNSYLNMDQYNVVNNPVTETKPSNEQFSNSLPISELINAFK